MSKIIVPLHLANLANIPTGADPGFKKFYLRSNWVKLYDGTSETDLVLDRPLDNYVSTTGTVTSADTVLTALEKLNGNIVAVSASIPSKTGYVPYIGATNDININSKSIYSQLYTATNWFTTGIQYNNFTTQDKLNGQYITIKPNQIEVSTSGTGQRSYIKSDFITLISKTHQLPNVSGTFAISVNGIAANTAGDITIPTSSSPLTTKGDLYTYSTLNARLSVGSNGQILTADSDEVTGLKWVSASNTIVSGYFSPDTNTLTLVDSDGGTVVINNEINIIQKTFLDITMLMYYNELIPGVVYNITDADDLLYNQGGTSLFLLALTPNTLDTTGTGKFYNPKYNNALIGYGIWDITNSYAPGDTAIWGGYVWTNQDGTPGDSIDSYNLESASWKLENYNDTLYNVVYDKIKYDIKKNRIVYRNEENVNEVSYNFSDLDKFNTEVSDYSPIKAFQWGNVFYWDTVTGDYMGIGNQKITNSYNQNINFRGQAQYDITLSNYSYMYDLYAQPNVLGDLSLRLAKITLESSYFITSDFQKNVKLENIVLINNSSLSNLYISDGSLLTNLNISNQSYITGLNLDNSLLSNFNISNYSFIQTTALTDASLNNYSLNNGSFIRTCTFINVVNGNVTYDNVGSQVGVTVNSFHQKQVTVNNASITSITEEQNGWFFLGDLPNSNTTNLVGRDANNRLVDLISPLPTKTSDLINDGDNGVSHFISLEDLPSNLTFYATTAASGISTYSKLVTSITDLDYNTTAVNVPTGTITTTGQFIAGLITTPNIIVGNPGIFNVTTIGNITRTSGTGVAEFYFIIYKRTAAGVETVVATSNLTLPVTNGGYTEFSASGLWNDGVFGATDMVVIKYYANRVPTGSDPTYNFQFGGTSPVRTLVPVPLNVVPVVGLLGVHTLKVLASGQSSTLSINGSSTTIVVGIANRMTLLPYIPNVTFTCASLYINITTAAAAANARILIYSDLNGVPNTKLYESTNLDCSTTGIKTTLTGFLFVAGTSYWLSIHSSSTPTYSAYNVAQIIPISAFGNTNYIAYISNQTFGSAPTTLITPSVSSVVPPFIGINF